MSTFILPLDTRGGQVGATRIGVKDLIDMEGLPTTCGSKVLAAGAAGAPADAACLTGIRAAEASGTAVIVGKTNLHELAFGVTGVNPWFGTPVNPLDAGRVPGGSSSGSAVAVATGDADIALGSDTGGSIRIPAACCGIVGLKTTRGRISLEGVHPLAPSLDTIGPMGATVDAVARGMELLEAGFAWRRQPPAARIGRFRPPAERWVDEAVDGALDAWQAADRSRAVVDLPLPGWEAATEAVGVVLASEAWAVHHQLWTDHRDELSPDVAPRLEMGSLLDPSEVAAAWETARQWLLDLKTAFGSVDLIALPVMAAAPPRLDEAGQMASIRYTGPFNLAGVPAIAMPVWGPSRRKGLPASLQLAGPAGGEELLLSTAAAFEAVAAGGGRP
jgi:amidase